MKIAIPKERRAHESRVAASPETVKKMIGLGAEVAVEKGAGTGSNFTDDAYKTAGATVGTDVTADADVVLKVQRPIVSGKDAELTSYKSGAVVMAICDPYRAGDDVSAMAKSGATVFAMDLVPRITRAQSMDVLSSQSNLAGYKAVLDASAEYASAFPMMMTAAGTVAPAKVLVMGAGVAGLQAIATAKRLGAVVSATDVRPAAKEQVESLGGTFVAVEDEEFKQAETAGGYAKEMSDDYKKKQAELIAETIKKQDIVITTALIPGRPAPMLVSADMVKSMKPGSVIVDLAVENGGNCELAQAGKVVTKHGVKIVGHYNVPSRVAADASALYARNLFNLLQLLVDGETKALAIDWEDEIVKGTCITRDGKIVHPGLAPKEDTPPKEEAAVPDAGDDTAEGKSSNTESGQEGESGSPDKGEG
ncbi:Re/Si-specific NAD(P)(+) transhydrogenase subunit alpha [Denitrobaculum tricleocarpae]|uniref:NAD(P) transhydrogenase subunit alpha part 1 n=1 Tax=Denitrobaculum tricleocarpae TaxID=2591009 RepID=A0A545TWU8_9PROT|nr:Re/Si-specific NAD(P)(+) transhydrogenase subunit alpha [Denitrobaculum tricleocarpae]TQV81692.1 Re/Si-specific NAD(P)(+) transhydrogenase subunit alpha [Denitrobaculum tricleocarpae]